MAECDAPGASVARVALARGINANVVHRWRQLARQAVPGPVARAREFVAVEMPAQTSAQRGFSHDIQIEVRRGAVLMKVSWPVSAAGEFATWAREVLR
jgi:transposase